MGGDFAPEAPVMGAIDAAKAYGAQILLVGRGEEILEVLKKNGIENLPEGIEIAHADDVVDMHDDPGKVIHKRKNSSMVIGLRMLAKGKTFEKPYRAKRFDNRPSSKGSGEVRRRENKPQKEN
ncbi:MAG: hypothetical protein IJO53_07115 [Clostridia bacterium]|nr:hypothetical protein [Clostridia bacterium]